MDFQLFLNSVLLVFAGILLLRISGRKSISQMTLAQTVIMISIGSVIIQPIVETSVVRTIAVTSIFVLSLVIIEWLQLKFNFIEKIFTGKSKVVIKDGKLQTAELRKHRLTIDQLEMFVRQQGISKLSDIKTASLEPNGQLGYELKEDARPLTIGEFKKLIHPSMLNPSHLPIYPNHDANHNQNDQIFDELSRPKEDKHTEYLQ